MSRPLLWRLRQRLGPGLIAGASDDDPSGIATYSQAGARFGLDTGWIMLFSWPLMCAVQEISARIGRVTGRGIAGNLARHYPRKGVMLVIALLFIANTINIGANLGAMGAALRLVIGGPELAYVVVFAIISVILEVFVCYANYVRVLKWLTLILLAYAGVALYIDTPWLEVLHSMVLPRIEFSQAYLTMLVAILGTTISPYLFFWQAEDEVEQMNEGAAAKDIRNGTRRAVREFRRIRFDTLIGMGVSNLVGLFIIITCATTLNAHGVHNIETSAQAAEALRPIAGPAVFVVFALGIIGTGLLSIPVLAASAGYALGEALGWPVGLAKKSTDAKAFYATIAVATLIGAAMNFSSIDPFAALFYSAVINGIVAIPIIVMMMHLGTRRDVMGEVVLPTSLRILGWGTAVVMSFSAVAMGVASF